MKSLWGAVQKSSTHRYSLGKAQKLSSKMERCGFICNNSHLTEASSVWPQLWMSLWEQSGSVASKPEQRTSSMRIDPSPAPKQALLQGIAAAPKSMEKYEMLGKLPHSLSPNVLTANPTKRFCRTKPKRFCRTLPFKIYRSTQKISNGSVLQNLSVKAF